MQALNQKWLLLSLALAALSGLATYQLSNKLEISRVNQYSLDKASVILALTDSYVSTYSNLRTSTDTLPVPAAFRAAALERFQQMPQVEDLVISGMVGMPGNEIRTSAYDDVMRAQLLQMDASNSKDVMTSTVTSGRNTIHRSLFPSHASTQACADCHNTIQQKPANDQWQQGDMMGAYVVDRFIGADLALAARSSLVLAILAAMLTSALALAASYFLAQKRLAIKLEKLASIDPLTGCINRRAMYDRISDLSDDTSGALLMIDIDKFKKINDNYGHAAGDEVLKHFSASAISILRATDWVARVGGEEFIVWLPNAREEHAKAVSERLRAQAEAATVHFDGTDIRYTTSIGVQIVEDKDPTQFDRWVQSADALLYRAKETGRNRVVCCTGAAV